MPQIVLDFEKKSGKRQPMRKNAWLVENFGELNHCSATTTCGPAVWTFAEVTEGVSASKLKEPEEFSPGFDRDWRD